jgi:hypothetical protein
MRSTRASVMRSRSEAPRASRLRDSGGPAAVIALLVVSLVAPALALSLAWSRPADEEDQPQGEASFLLSSSARSTTLGALMDAQWAEPYSAVAPSWSGIVSSILVAPGDTVDDGTPVLRIDGVEIRYYVTDQPIYKEVCEGDASLVDEVRRVLQAQEIRVGDTKTIGRRDVTAIREYAAAIGVPGASTVSCFDPGWIIFGTKAAGPIQDIHLTVGAPPPSAGDPVFTGARVLDGLELRGDTGVATLDRQLSSGGDGTFASSELVVGGVSTGVSLADLASSEGRLRLQDQIRPEVNDALPTGGVGSTASEPQGVAVAVGLRESQYIVPATSVVGTSGGAACVVLEGSRAVVEVTLIGSSINGLLVDFDHPPEAEAEILVTPSGVSCG